MKLVDAKGKEIACFRKERFGAGKRAHITVKNNGQQIYGLAFSLALCFQEYCQESQKVRLNSSVIFTISIFSVVYMVNL